MVVEQETVYKELKEGFPHVVQIQFEVDPGDPAFKSLAYGDHKDRRVQFHVEQDPKTRRISELCTLRFYRKTKAECDELIEWLRPRSKQVTLVKYFMPFKENMSGVEYVKKLPHGCRYRLSINLSTPEVMQALAAWCKTVDTVYASDGFYRRAKKYGADPIAEQIYCQTWEDILTVQLMVGHASGKLTEFKEM